MTAAGRWAAAEAHAAAGKLLALAELIRRYPGSAKKAGNGDMPVGWELGLDAQAALELAVSAGSADGLLSLAHTLVVRLPLTLAALADGILDLSKVRMIGSETGILDDADAGEAERQLSGYWKGRTWAQLHAKLSRIVCNLDPDAVRKKREAAEREDARVRFWREATGACGLAGYGLPADQALQANARIQARARAYRKAGVPGSMDQLRARAYLDMLTGQDTRDSLSDSTATDCADYPDCGDCTDDAAGTRGADEDGHDDAGRGARDADENGGLGGGAESAREAGESDDGDDGPDSPNDDEDGRPPNDDGGGGPPDGGPGRPGGPGSAGLDGYGYGDGLAANVDLTLPLSTLIELAERAGEAAWLGAIDPSLVRRLGIAVVRNLRSRFRLIITGPDGRAVGFGIARERKKRRPGRGNPPPLGPAAPAGPAGQPATPLNRDDSTGAGFEFSSTAGQAVLPLDGAGGNRWGTWRLSAAGREWDIEIIPLPAPGPCDHRYGTGSYQPGDTLRALVQVRDGQCAMPVCAHPAQGCEWEHAVPWPAGSTCMHNGGLHCKKDHRIKEAQNWKIEQLADGRRIWTTPAGLRYKSHHRQYPD